MTLADRIAALSAPDRAMDAEIAHAIFQVGDVRCNATGWPEGSIIVPCYPGWMLLPHYTTSIDAAMTLASPALQAHTMAEAQKLLGPRGFTVGKFTEALAIAICVVALRERGL